MNLEEQINGELKTAMLSKNEAAVRSLRAIKQAILIAKTSGSGDLKKEDEIKMLQKLVKQRKESVDIYQQQNRADLAGPELEEIAIIEKYLPSMLSEDEIRAGLKTIISGMGNVGPQEMGKVMGAATKHFAGKADNKMVSLLVKELLGGS
ncbi:MAG: GatB/YqeY domain-containing protein [Bacteroidetes bacterium]|nr:MAG: GatB/YqeY domain-containing protein [Bacteroidota bacterium]